jgi:hypothetical protein
MIKAAHVPSKKMACQGVITALFNGSTGNSGGKIGESCPARVGKN